jgi:dihydropteroate synthase
MTAPPAGRLPERSDRLVVMGVLNVTPDSFSDGGRYADPDSALAHALEMSAQGADLIDVGGESTRPGAVRVPAEEEARRVLPVIEQLSSAGLTVSVDTYRAAVAERALAAGARIVNDVSGGLGDSDMARVVRDAGCPWILMHWRGHSADMNSLAHYQDVVADVRSELLSRVDEALAAGVDAGQLVLDPGLGFAKRAHHNWALLAHLEALTATGLPVLLGASRKSFLGSLLAEPPAETVAIASLSWESTQPRPRPSSEREDATTALTMFAALNGAWGVRVHQVRPNVDAALVAAAILAAR